MGYCNFEKGFTKRFYPFRELTEKDIEGIKLVKWIIGVIVMLVCAIFAYVYKSRELFLIMTSNSILLLLCLIYLIVSKPIRLLYLAGWIISRNINPTGPFLDVNKFFPNHKYFVDTKNFKDIKKEVLRMLPYRHKLPLTKNTFNGQNNYIGSDIDGNQRDDQDGWRIMMVSIGRKISTGGRKNFPKLSELIERCPEILSCAVSILPGRKGIPIHIGYYKGILRYQLGVVIPNDKENCFICVNGEKYNWSSGDDVMFDDTFAHKVYNNTDEIRVVIYMDIARPFLPDGLNEFNEFILKMFENNSSVQKEISRTEYQIDLKDAD